MINSMRPRSFEIGVIGEVVSGMSRSFVEEGGHEDCILTYLENFEDVLFTILLGVNTDGDPELLDDSEFYQQLLKEFMESYELSSSETAFFSLKSCSRRSKKLLIGGH